MKNLAFAMRPILMDMVATLVFAGIFALTKNLYVSTGLAVAIGVGQVVWELRQGRTVPWMQWASLALVLCLGAASVFTGDARFVMIKPTLIYLVVAAAMLERGWMMRYMPPQGRLYLPEGLIIAGGYVWAALMVFTALANLVIALTCDRQTWVTFIGVFPLASKLLLFFLHFGIFRLIAGLNARAQGRAALNGENAGAGDLAQA